MEDVQNKFGDVLKLAVKEHDEPTLKLLSTVWNQIPRPKLQEALMITIKQDDAFMADYLLSRGAKAEGSNDDSIGETSLLHVALNFECFDVAKSLVEYGACLDKKNKQDETPLHVLAKKAHLSLMKELVERGADARAVNNLNQSCLFYAALSDDPENVNTLKYLLNKEILNINAKDLRGHNILECRLPELPEVIRPDCEAIALLIQYGLCINQVNEYICSCEDHFIKKMNCSVNVIVAKILSLNTNLGEEIIGKLLIPSEVVYGIQYELANQLTNETELMSQIFITPKHCLFDLMGEPRNQLQKLHGNQHLKNILTITRNTLTQSFPLLGDLLMIRLTKAQVRAENAQKCCEIGDQIMARKLSQEPLKKIFSYLSNPQQQNFIDASKHID